MRWWLADSPPQRGDAERTNYLLRPLSILLLLMVANYAHLRAEDGPAYSTAHFLMTSFPRLTFELVIASHIAQGRRRPEPLGPNPRLSDPISMTQRSRPRHLTLATESTSTRMSMLLESIGRT